MATVAAVQMTSGPEPAANLQVAARLIAEAAGQGAELVLLDDVRGIAVRVDACLAFGP